jgi:hypothetical protein
VSDLENIISDLENIIKKLKQLSEADRPRSIIIYVYDGELGAEEETAKKSAIAEYKSKHPDWKPSHNDVYMRVPNERTKTLLQEIEMGIPPHANNDNE